MYPEVRPLLAEKKGGETDRLHGLSPCMYSYAYTASCIVHAPAMIMTPLPLSMYAMSICIHLLSHAS